MKTFHLLLLPLVVLLFIRCQKDGEPACYTKYTRLEEIGPPRKAWDKTVSNLRMLNNIAWFTSGGKALGVNMIDQTSFYVENPTGVTLQIRNPDDIEHPYLGTSGNRLWIMDTDNKAWKLLFETPTGTVFGSMDFNLTSNHLPIVLKNESGPSTAVWLLDLNADSASEVVPLNQWVASNNFVTIGQPIYLPNAPVGPAIALLVVDDSDTSSIALYNIEQQTVVRTIALSAFRRTTLVPDNDRFCYDVIMGSYSTPPGMERVDLETGKILWTGLIADRKPIDGYLLGASSFFGWESVGVYNAETGESVHPLSWGISRNDYGGLLDGDMCFVGKDTTTTDSRKTRVVLVNPDTNCETMRISLPGKQELQAVLTYEPDKTILSFDVDGKLRLLKPK